VELQARWPLPRPSWPWDPPGLYGHSTGWTRGPFQDLGCLALVCFSRARRSRLASVSSTSSSCRPDAWLAPFGLLHPDGSRSTSPDAQRGHPRRSPFWSAVRCLVRVSKDRPSTVSRAEESTPREHVAVITSETGRQPASCAAFVVWTTLAVCSSPTRPGCCTGLPVMGFVMFHRRDSEFPSRAPALRSLAPCAQRTGVGLLRHAVGLRHPSRSPWSVHREPCLLALGRRLLLVRRCLHTAVTKPDTLPGPRGLSPSAEP
jgi:hypothetical protein